MKTFLVALGYRLIEFAVGMILDNVSRRVIETAIAIAETSSNNGQDKMDAAIEFIKSEGTTELKKLGVSRLRTMIEAELDRLQRRASSR